MDLAASMSVADVEEAIRGTWAPILRAAGPPVLAGDAPNEAVMRAVHALLRDPVCLARGEFLTTIERLGVAWANPLLEYVCQIRAYRSERWARFECWSTVRNVGGVPCTIVKAVRQRALPGRGTLGGGNDYQISGGGGRHRIDATNVVLDPGEEIELPAERAIAALRRYSWEARTTGTQETTSQLRSEFPLREVAYRAEWVDPETEEARQVNSRGSGRRRSSD